MFAAMTVATAASCLFAATSLAQETIQDDEAIYGVSELLSAPLDIQRAKRKRARESGEWVASAMASAAASFDTNVHQSPDNRESSAFEAYGAAFQALRYPGDAHRVKIDVEATGRHYQESATASDQRFEGSLLYGYRPGKKYSVVLTTTARHATDSATTIDGEELTRDLAYTAYRTSASLWLYPAEGHALRLAHRAQRRDYASTPGLGSLDWWKYGPRVAYHFDLNHAVEMEASYAFSVQTYDEEPASNASGKETATSPDEEHYFHRADGEVRWLPRATLPLTLGYTFKRKDDRFQDYESYSGHTMRLGVDWNPTPRLHFHTSGRLRLRDYDKRPAGEGNNLEYDRWTALATASYRLSHHVSGFVTYELDFRDSNRSIDRTTFRDYERHLVLTGLTVAY